MNVETLAEPPDLITEIDEMERRLISLFRQSEQEKFTGSDLWELLELIPDSDSAEADQDAIPKFVIVLFAITRLQSQKIVEYLDEGKKDLKIRYIRQQN